MIEEELDKILLIAIGLAFGLPLGYFAAKEDPAEYMCLTSSFGTVYTQKAEIEKDPRDLAFVLTETGLNVAINRGTITQCEEIEND